MTGHGEKLSRNQERAIAALLTNSSIPAAAQKINVGEKTLWRWMQTEQFRTAYLDARREVVRQAIALVQAGMSEAVQTLRDVMSNAEAPASARVSAAKAMIDTGLKAAEFEDLAERVGALEKQIGGNKR